MISRPGKLNQRTVTDKVPARPVIAPTVASVNIPANAATHVVIDFAIGGTPPILPSGTVTGFVVTKNGSGATVSSSSRTGEHEITLVLAVAVIHTDVLTLAYTAGDVTDTATSALGNFSGRAITNNVA